MQRRLWTQMCTLFNKNMKYDLASRELKDTYKNINERCSLRLGHGYKTSSDPTQCTNSCESRGSTTMNPESFYSHGPVVTIRKMRKICFFSKHTDLHLSIWNTLNWFYVLQKQHFCFQTNKPKINCSLSVKWIDYLIDGLSTRSEPAEDTEGARFQCTCSR